MFGINNNQPNAPGSSASPNDAGAPLPPSPFMDSAAPSAPADSSSQSASEPPLPDLPPISNDPPPAITTNHSAPSAAASAPPVPQSQEGLISIKSQALNNLAPLVGHLDQSPEEKFKTTMMLIQASDNADLVKDAYELANQIPDEKLKAQALLDVVNEINYFTQKDKGEKPA